MILIKKYYITYDIRFKYYYLLLRDYKYKIWVNYNNLYL